MTKEENEKRWLAYFYPNTNTLINKLGIKDKEQLSQIEADISFKRNVELYDEAIRKEHINENFKEEHLRDIHKYLFGDLYEWAGSNRIVYMQKNNSYFSEVEEIDASLKSVFDVTNEELSSVVTIYDFAAILSSLYTEILHIHPFREGNGRTVREFIREFANEKSKSMPFGEMEFHWDRVDGNILDDSIRFAIAFRSVIELQFVNALVPKEKNNIK